MPTIREKLEQREYDFLEAGAAKSADTLGRLVDEPPCDLRTDFQRDRDRIIHCSTFRRLKHKTQVFLSPEGDHYRTRLTHTLEVSQIARTIARTLGLNEDLTEAIALGHDLGHTPFGHAGERALDLFTPFGFRHYEQSVRVCRILERQGRGLNLTAEVLDGIECHTSGREASTLEGRVVRTSDLIAYMNHDIDDAIRAGVIGEQDIPGDLRDMLGHKKSERIDCMVRSVCECSLVGSDNMAENRIAMSPEIGEASQELRKYLFSSLYVNPKAKAEEGKITSFLRRMYEYYCLHAMELPYEYTMIMEREGTERAVTDFIAGMTDRYAVRIFQKLFVPKNFSD